MQCGLCAIVAGLFRRAMCIAGSRRGSGESCYQDYQELATEARRASNKKDGAAIEGAAAAGSLPNAATTTTTTTTTATLPVSALISERRSAEVTVDSNERNAVFIRISEDAVLTTPVTTSPALVQVENKFLPLEDLSRRISNGDKILLDSLDIGRSRSRHTGRFLTMHKRRRKKLTTRSLSQEQAILDDIFHGLVQCVLQKAGNWRFNAFTLETVTGGRSLPVLCVHLFHWYGLFQHFNLDVVTVWKLFTFIEDGYHSTNPYHNSVHATDVTQAMHCFLQEEKIRTHLTSLEIMASLIAAVTHDLDHPGVNQPFLVATSNHLAALYQNTSVLENHHWRSAIGCLLDSGVSEQLAPDVRPELQRHISSLILATDITRQQEFLTRFKRYLDDNLLDMQRPEDRHFILQIALKCADISNPCRPWDISRKWSYKVCEEFFRQGDYERRLNLPVTPLCDRHTTSIPKIQAGFFKFVVTPLYEEWHRFLGDGLSVSLMQHLRANQSKWEALVVEETAEETETEISELDEAVNDIKSAISSDESECDDDDTRSGDLLIPFGCLRHQHQQQQRQQQGKMIGFPEKVIEMRLVGRRHSVPISMAKPSSLPTSSMMARNETGRRESLPSERYVKSKTDHHSIRLDDKLSPLSSRSSVLQSLTNISNTTTNGERPVSAENLLPDTSITSITNSAEASRLNSLLQNQNQSGCVGSSSGDDSAIAGNSSAQTKQLTRQQTFPPLQSYARMRYMSTTAEMSQCYVAETLTEAADSCSSNSSGSPANERLCSGGGRCGTPDVDCSRKSKSREVLAPIELQMYKRRGSMFTDHVRQKTEFVIDQRRHSVQNVRHDDYICGSNTLKSNLKRPSSAQESEPARIFCALTTAPRNIGNGYGVNSNASGNCCDHGNGNNAQTAAPRPGQEDESKRLSTLTIENRTCFNEMHGARRFTTVPVSSEISNHKVFFIGSPPDSPPRIQSTSSSIDGSGNEKRGSTGADGGVASCDRVANNGTVVNTGNYIVSGNGSSDIGSIGKKKDSVDCVREKGVNKVAKICPDSYMKENVDPRGEEFGKSTLIRKGSQGWARRRGSAPVGLLSRIDDFSLITASVPPLGADRHSRRGSVPTDINTHQGGGPSVRLALGTRDENFSTPRRASLPHEATLRNLLGNVLSVNIEQENYTVHSTANINNNNNTNASNNNNGLRSFDGSLPVPVSGMLSPRRGSVPADISELRRDFFGRGSVNGKSRNRKKVLMRRSSGGPEMFSVVCSAFGAIDTSECGDGVGDGSNGGEDDASSGGSGSCPTGGAGGTWLKWKRDSLPDPIIKRRGSLPIEMVAITHAGQPMLGVRRSSLWRL